MERLDPPPSADEFEVTSVYVPMRDGVRLAVSILTPPGRSRAAGDGGGRWPAIHVFTRYGRAMKPAVLAARNAIEVSAGRPPLTPVAAPGGDPS